ncbi:MAG: thioesterase [Actinobacteria bacterium]|nr:thioesterase [Actinomycetota bacterium]
MSPMPGSSASIELLVTADDTAIAHRSGEVPVLATPRVIALCEQAAFTAVASDLSAGQTTVSMKVQIDHLAPSAIGQTVTAEATVEKVQGRRIMFTVSVHDDHGLIAVGRVTRVVVDAEEFLAKANRSD